MSEAPTADILCVDDNAANLRSLEALLGDVRANIVQAHSGDDALRQLLTGDFAVILLDIQMPNLDGFETAQLIRARERTRHVPIIFLTALNRAEVNVIKGYALGAVDFLFKPIVPEILRSKVNVFLELHQQRRQAQAQATLLREAERRENERRLAEARQQYERSLLREEMDRERKVKEALGARAEELSRLVEEKVRGEKRLALLADSANDLLMAQEGTGHVEAYHRVVTHLELDVHLEYRMRGEALQLTSHSGLDANEPSQLARVRSEDTISGRVAADRVRYIHDDLDAHDDPRSASARALGLRAVACFPLVAHGRLMGTVAFGSRKPRRFDGDEIALMQIVCDQVAVSLERDRLIDELRDGDRRKDEFLAMLAHELRNPMAPIRAAVDVIRNLLPADQEEKTDPRIVRALDSADRQVVHMIRLVDDLLDVSRITRGKVELRKAPVLLQPIVEQAVAATEPSMRERRHTLTVDLPKQPVELLADGTRITQVIANLLHNASKYTNSGGQIRLSARPDGDALEISIRDSGIGIARELLPRVFEIFVQAEPTSDRASGGLGLGLTLVKTLVEMHEGTVEARSEGLGRGSEFVVRLPLGAQPEAAREPATVRAARNLTRLPPLDILLVEDNADIRSTMRDLLELHGHRVVEAEDGEQGLALALSGKPAVALVDIGLPGLDGYTVAERIRSQTNGHGPRLVALTGFGTPEASQRALQAGFDAHLVKPISFADLSRVLQKLV